MSVKRLPITPRYIVFEEMTLVSVSYVVVLVYTGVDAVQE